MNKKPIIILTHIVIFILATSSTILKLMDENRFQLNAELLGKSDAYLDYLMDTVLLVMSIYLFYGFLKAKRWAYSLTYYFYLIYFVGVFAGLYVGITHFDKVMEVASILKYGEIRPNPVTLQSFVWISSIMILIKVLISFFSCVHFIKKKNIFQINKQ